MANRFLALLVLAVSAGAQTPLPEGKGKAILQGNCQECHGLEDIVILSMPADEWRKSVLRMTRKGATLQPAEIDTLVDYLAANFGPEKINLNTAETASLQAALGLTTDEAEAVIRFRHTNGLWKDWDDLAKKSPVLAKKLEAKRSAITFR